MVQILHKSTRKNSKPEVAPNILFHHAGLASILISKDLVYGQSFNGKCSESYSVGARVKRLDVSFPVCGLLLSRVFCTNRDLLI